MRISRLAAYNYKSLRSICIEPGDLSVVVGANAAGKSNLADFHDFLADLYRHGLAVAVARKGGYENIAHRKMRRSRGAISAGLTVIFDKKDLRASVGSSRFKLPKLRFSHDFAFRTEGQAIRADFKIDSEKIVLEEFHQNKWHTIVYIKRDGSTFFHQVADETHGKSSHAGIYSLSRQLSFLRNLQDFVESESVSPTELLLGAISRFVPILRRITSGLSEIRVFQISPTNSREFGVPIPNPEMDRYGGNLPAVVDMLIKRHSKSWNNIVSIMRQLLPGLERIDVDYTHSRTLGLYFHEKGVGRPWTVAEISDGTIHSLALLVALFDPRTTMLVVEEPENSVHTWILRTLMDAAQNSSVSKQVLITTHSRVVVDSASARDIWIMWRKFGESHAARLNSLDPDIIALIEEGDSSAFELLDTGLVSEALPPAPE